MEDRGAWCATVHGVAKNQTRLRGGTATTTNISVTFTIADNIYVDTNSAT